MKPVFCFDDYELDSTAFQLRHAGAPVRLDATVLRVLEVLVRNPGKLVSKEELIGTVWGGRAVSENSLTVAMARLRKKLDEHGSRDRVLTVHGQGYRFAHPVEVREREVVLPLGAAQSSFVGREQVMQQLTRALDDLRGGAGGMIALHGDSGVGKTRVAEVLAAQAERAGCAVAWGYCRELSPVPALWPFVELLRGVIHEESTRRCNGHLRSLLPELSPLLSEVREANAFAKLESPHQVFDLVARALTVVAETAPHVLIIDDLQCADDASLELLHYLLAGIVRSRVLILVTCRHVRAGGDPAERVSAVLNHRNCVRIELEPLGPEAVASYVAARPADDPALARRLYALSEGNPRYLHELLRQLPDAQLANAEDLTLPPSVIEHARARLSGLDSETQEVLMSAAVIGRGFGLPLLAAAADRTPAALMKSLDRACAAEILASVTETGTLFRFTHGALRAALYEQQTPAQRRVRHLRVAHAIEQRVPRAELPCSELAEHMLAALPEGDLHKTVEYCSQAATLAESQCAFAQAIRYLKCAREALDMNDDADPELRFQLLYRQALLVRAHSSEAFLPLADQLLQLARARSGAALAAASLLLDPLPGFPRLPSPRGALTDALSALPDDAISLRPALMAQLASSAPMAYDGEASYAQIERALVPAAQSRERVDRWSTRFAELYLYGGPLHDARGTEVLRALDRMCIADSTLGQQRAMQLDLHRALKAMQAGDRAAASRAFERWELRLRDADGGSDMHWHLLRLRALMEINLGHETQGRAALIALHRSRQCCTSPGGNALFCAYDHSMLFWPGDLRVAPSLVLVPDVADPPNIWAMKVRALVALGAIDEARSALELVPVERLTQLPCDREYLGTMGALARAAVRLRARRYIRSIYHCLRPFSERFAVNLSGLCEGSVSLLLGHLARSAGASQAAQHFAAAVRLSEHAGYARSEAEARMELSQCRSSN